MKWRWSEVGRWVGRVRFGAPGGSLVVFWIVTSLGTLAASDYQVIFNEIHYNPLGGAEAGDLEFVELRNLSPRSVSLEGWSLVEGVAYDFPPGASIPPRGYLLLSADPASAAARFGLAQVYGPYTGRLDNNGEVLALANALGEIVNRIHYEDGGSWPSMADGLGPSLEYKGADTANDLAARWGSSDVFWGTPGRPNSRSLEEGESPRVRGILNEVRGPLAAGEEGYIELYNPTDSRLELGGHQLLFSGGALLALPPSVSLPAGSWQVLRESDLGGAISGVEQTIVLLKPDSTTIVDALETRRVSGSQSFGRFPDGGGSRFVFVDATPGQANVYRADSPVIVNEIQFHPRFVPPAGDCELRCSDAFQWLELWNRSAAPVDLGGWRLTKGVDFDFANNTIIPAGGALVVAASRAGFQIVHPGVTNVVGDWAGRLRHDSEEIVLRDSLGNPADRVEYGDGKPLNDLEPTDGSDDRTFRGSPWPLEADGSGRTLERVHPELDGSLGLSWRASSAVEGSPGEVNSVFDPSPAPAVDHVDHEPAVPRSDEPVVVTCTISSVGGLTAAEVLWSIDGGGGSGSVLLADDGLSGDAVAGDGVYTGTLPAQDDGDVVAFRIRASGGGGTTELPLQPARSPYAGFDGVFFLYEVDDSDPPENGNPLYRIVMREEDVVELGDRPVESNVLLPATFISGEKVRYAVGVRYRGEHSRDLDNRSLRVDFRPERTFEGIAELNLNAANGGSLDTSSAREIVAIDLFRRSGLGYPQAWPVTLHFPGEVERDFDTRFIRKESYDDTFLERFFGGSHGGNLYRGLDPPGAGDGDLTYLGEDPEDYRPYYEKQSNEEEDDYSDIIALTRAFDPDETSDFEFPDVLEGLIDVRAWARFFAVMSMLGNSDGGIWNRTGEDYFLYRVPEDSPRADRGKWLIFPWDVEEAFSDADEPLFEPRIDAIRRFLTHPRFARVYYEEVARVRAGIFSRLEMRGRFGFVASMFDAEDVFNVVDPMDSFVARRLGNLDQDVPGKLVVQASIASEGDEELVAPGAIWRFFRGSEPPPGGPSAWVMSEYSDDSWERGPAGFGMGDNDDATELDDMSGSYTTVFIRHAFDVPNLAMIPRLRLDVDYDDAFVAYLNGSEVARSDNAPGASGDPIPYDATATESHEAGNPEEFGLSVGALREGRNVIALVGMNSSLQSGDFSLHPVLLVPGEPPENTLAAGCGDVVYAGDARVQLAGTIDPGVALSVRINGVLAETEWITSGDGPFGLRWHLNVPLEPGDTPVVLQGFANGEGTGSPTTVEEIVVRRAESLNRVVSDISGDAVWTAAESPYWLAEAIEVDSGGSLTIEPGVTVLVSGGAGIEVSGEFTALGTEESPIVFMPIDCRARWEGLRFRDTGTGDGSFTHRLRHCLLRHGDNFTGAAGFLEPVSSKLSLENCMVESVTANAIDGSDAVVEILNSVIDDAFEGVHCSSSTVTILDTVIRNLRGDSDAIDFDGDGDERCVVGRCLIENSTDDGLDLGSNSVDVFGNVFRGIQDKAVSIQSSGRLGEPTLTWNLIHDSGTGIALKNGVNVQNAHHNTVTRCIEGIDAFAKDAARNGGHGEFHSSICAGNVIDVRFDSLSTLAFDYSLVGGEAPWPGERNIVGDPRFSAPEAGEFALRPGSPCIGTAQDGSDMGAVPFDGAVLFVRGDSNEDGIPNLSDAVYTLNHLFLGGPIPSCEDRLDANDDGVLNITDGVFLLTYLFLGGAPIPPPHPEPGSDPTPDSLPCEQGDLAKVP